MCLVSAVPRLPPPSTASLSSRCRRSSPGLLLQLQGLVRQEKVVPLSALCPCHVPCLVTAVPLTLLHPGLFVVVIMIIVVVVVVVVIIIIITITTTTTTTTRCEASVARTCELQLEKNHAVKGTCSVFSDRELRVRNLRLFNLFLAIITIIIIVITTTITAAAAAAAAAATTVLSSSGVN